MAELVFSPSRIDIVETFFYDPVTGTYYVPTITYTNTLFQHEVDVLNNDKVYINRVIENFYLKLTEKWLYKFPDFKGLLKYFKLKKDGEKTSIKMVSHPDEAKHVEMNRDDEKFIFRYIEKIFINKHFVKKVLKKYVHYNNIKWYDLFHNTSTLKRLFVKKLKDLIVTTIYQLQEKKKK